jgi:hypothetical protein
VPLSRGKGGQTSPPGRAASCPQASEGARLNSKVKDLEKLSNTILVTKVDAINAVKAQTGWTLVGIDMCTGEKVRVTGDAMEIILLLVYQRGAIQLELNRHHRELARWSNLGPRSHARLN